MFEVNDEKRDLEIWQKIFGLMDFLVKAKSEKVENFDQWEFT